MYRIKEIAKDQQLTLKEVAAKIEVAPNTLSRIINGENTTIDMLQKIATILNVEIRDLFKTSPISGFVKIHKDLFEINSISDLQKVLEISENLKK